MLPRSRMLFFVAAVTFFLYGCAAPNPSITPTSNPGRVYITVLYDAFGKPSTMEKDWGYAALIEYGGKRILFDTGDNSVILEKNARAKGVDLSRLDFVILSHRHSDHMGGMSYLLRVNPKVRIYAPKENFGIYGFSLPSSFYRKDPSLAAEQRYFDGNPPPIMKFGSAWPQANFNLIEKTTEIVPGIHLIALVSDRSPTLELRELSLAIETPDGMVLIVGCSHPGIDRIVAAAAAINPHIRLIAGGLHLVTATDEEIGRIATVLHDTFRVEYIAPGHCTGEPTFAVLKKAFGNHYLYAGLGTTVTSDFPSNLATMDEDDLRSYRALLAGSDDIQVASMAVAVNWSTIR